MSWSYEGREFTGSDEHYGFVYEIVNLETGRRYLGRKYLTRAGYKTVKKKRKRIRVESDWRDYYGSNRELQEDVERLGRDKFSRTILRLCKTRGECAYYETKLILETDAILRSDYYNGWVSAKIQTSHVKNLLIEEPMDDRTPGTQTPDR